VAKYVLVLIFVHAISTGIMLYEVLLNSQSFF